ncbi:hydroxymethylglutaryl-CoA lyase [Limimonas halophila]|uniref:hydroxymethylglutaryl-CoA lyase n=1 Tax=Limimonas halophila TaxID=1082479 RepID=A0A1G7QHD8_9PROT|nr:hydroxymethylglutaryl-CoA lyase [Limimonas halophila]SDF97921.1 hydroxymethylglutaryl-CoA lyase [Limimonas halophila]
MTFPERVTLVEVGPRDGLQNEPQPVSADTRIALVDRLAAAGLPVVEAGAFVSPRWVPQMADSDAVLTGITPRPGVRYPVLVPNTKGLDKALASGAREIAVFAAASETFSKKNINASIAESLERFAPVMEQARANGVAVRGYVSCVLGCPYEGAIAPEQVAWVAERLMELGCYEVSLGDTIGVGTPLKARRLVETVGARVPVEKLAAHFHDTYGQALANLVTVLDQGIATVDTAVAGLGGCPYAPGAAGNVATEDVLYMLDGMGIATGADLHAVAAIGRWISEQLDRPIASQAGKALVARACTA